MTLFQCFRETNKVCPLGKVIFLRLCLPWNHRYASIDVYQRTIIEESMIIGNFARKILFFRRCIHNNQC